MNCGLTAYIPFQLSPGPGNRISSSAIIQGGVLILPSVQHSDQGEYICRAFNTQGEHAARLVLDVQASSGTFPSYTISINYMDLKISSTLFMNLISCTQSFWSVPHTAICLL